MANVMTQDPLWVEINNALSLSDCNCKPGDPTCEDWRGRVHRLNTMTDAVYNVLKSNK